MGGVKQMMIMTEKPYGAISDRSIAYRFEQDGNYYIVDNASNVARISESDYKKLNCPVKKYPKKVR